MDTSPEEFGAANALVFNPGGTVTAVSEGERQAWALRWCSSAGISRFNDRKRGRFGAPDIASSGRANSETSVHPGGGSTVRVSGAMELSVTI